MPTKTRARPSPPKRDAARPVVVPSPGLERDDDGYEDFWMSELAASDFREGQAQPPASPPQRNGSLLALEPSPSPGPITWPEARATPRSGRGGALTPDSRSQVALAARPARGGAGACARAPDPRSDLPAQAPESAVVADMRQLRRALDTARARLAALMADRAALKAGLGEAVADTAAQVARVRVLERQLAELRRDMARDQRRAADAQRAREDAARARAEEREREVAALQACPPPSLPFPIRVSLP
jgi:hypothetical protein